MNVFLKPSSVALASGVGAHLLYFIRGEHHRMPFRWIVRSATGIASVYAATFFLTQYGLPTKLVLATLLWVCFFTGLYTSMTVYRVLFHPLRNFDGPFLSRVSNFYHSYMIRRSDNYLVMKKLHEQYGPIVRTGGLPLYEESLDMISSKKDC